MVKINNATEFVKYILSSFIHEGDAAVDATAGNGHDTVFLSKAVGESGRVYAFDIQKEALINTAKRLNAEECFNNCVLVCAGHENMAEHVSGEIAAAMFNLGYLPGCKSAVLTKAKTTLQALTQALTLLKKGGAVSVCFYPGHEGGALEYETVTAYAKALDPKAYDVLHCTFFNKAENGPKIVFIQKF